MGKPLPKRRACPFCRCPTADVKARQQRGLRVWAECCGCGARGPVAFASSDSSSAMRAAKREAIALWNGPGPALKVVGGTNILAMPGSRLLEEGRAPFGEGPGTPGFLGPLPERPLR